MEAYTVYSCALCLILNLKTQPNSETIEQIPVQHCTVSLDKPFHLSLFASIKVDYNNVYLIGLLEGLNEITYVTVQYMVAAATLFSNSESVNLQYPWVVQYLTNSS